MHSEEVQQHDGYAQEEEWWSGLRQGKDHTISFIDTLTGFFLQLIFFGAMTFIL